jgi:hypothetical protein
VELLNATKMQAAYTMGTEPSAREHIVVAVKGTFAFPERDGDVCELAEEQAPLVLADEFFGEPGFSAPRYEVDFALTKPKCDVLLNATAYAPRGEPVPKVQVGAKLGSWVKTFSVIGDRVWLQRGATFGPSRPKPFTSMPISYDLAYGGADNLHPDPSKHAAYMQNPIGRGFHQVGTGQLINGRPVPNTEALDDPVTVPWGNYRPMSFGPVGRGWTPRLKFAGTYDQNWLDNVFPFLPHDFDVRYYQAAPEDQQIDYPEGGEEVILINLTPEGRVRCRLPLVEVPVTFFPRRGDPDLVRAVIDTILIEPQHSWVMLTWRASRPLRRDVFEIRRIFVGQTPRAMWRAQVTGKSYFRSLGQAVEAAVAAREET